MSRQVWFTSDHHHFHKNIIKYSNRPWTFEEQTDKLIETWNSQVGILDDVYHLGDFAFAGIKKFDKVVDILNQLNGRIHLILGNHDYPNLWRRIEDANIPHIEWIERYKEIKVEGQRITLCHYALRHWNQMHYGAWNLHGHSHGSLPPIGKQLDVGIDSHPDFKLYSLDEIRDHMDRQEIFVADHHTKPT